MAAAKNSKTKWIVALVLLILMIVLIFVGYEFVQRKLIYPLKYEETLTKYAKEYDLDPNFVAAVICTESRFKEKAASGKGAMGLMQIMPDTGKWIAEKLKEEWAGNESLYEPERNIRYGCWFLRYLQDRYEGDTTLQLAGYNAGMGNVSKWLSDPQYSPDGKTLSNIPFKETDNYVKKVTSAHEKYRSLYALSY
ncbi:lytic transglycosylase domain-containing protein [Clostridia bacterium OttesenSCG-928-F22]|nr:lytic transglycosylase domain-containing protein [Clostridia bacterium OttesenSCG-928-F22]